MKKAGHRRRRRPRRRPLPRRRGRRVPELPESATLNAPRIGEVYTRGTLTLARLGREAPIAAASPDGPVLRNVEGGSLAARELYPETRQTRPGAPAAVAGHRHRRARPVRAARRHRGPAQAAPQSFLIRKEPVADPCVIRVRARDERRRRDRVAAAARLGGARHRGRAQPAADDEAPAREPGASDRHQRPHGALVHPRGGRRAPDRRADAPRRPAEVGAALPARAALPRRGEGDRRPGRAQPRHDRRLALPGGRGRGSLGRLLGGQGEGRDPRRRAASASSAWTTSTSGRT